MEKIRTSKLDRGIMAPIFRLPYNAQQVAQKLQHAYCLEVYRMGQQPSLTIETMAHINEVAEWLISPTPKPVLLFIGPPGGGKSTMAKAVATLYRLEKENAKKCLYGSDAWKLSNEERKFLDYCERTPQWVYESAIVVAQKPASEMYHYNTQSHIILDDIGREPSVIMEYGTKKTNIADMLEGRYDNFNICFARRTILTSNLDASRISAQYGDRVASRLRETCKIMVFTEAFR